MVSRGWLLALAGCNQFYGLDETVAGQTRCAVGGAFTSTEPVPIDGAYSVEAARFTSDRTLAYLSLCPPPSGSDPKPFCEIYTSPYSATTKQFSGFSRMTGVSAMNFYDAYPSLTSDHQHMLFGSAREGGVHIFVASTQNGSFDTPTIARLRGPAAQTSNEPFIVGQRVLYYSALVGSVQIFRMEGEPPQFGEQPQKVDGVDMPNSNEFAPVVREDELELFFGGGPNMMLDLFIATRESVADPFGAPAKIEQSTAGIDWPVWISPDACSLYHISKVDNLATLYVSKRDR